MQKKMNKWKFMILKLKKKLIVINYTVFFILMIIKYISVINWDYEKIN